MTDTNTTPAAHGIPPKTEGQITGEHAPAEDQPQSDQDSDEQLQREAEQDEQAEAERLAVLDLETEDDKAGRPLDAGVWGSTGHAGADDAMRMLQNCGLSTEDAMDLLLDAATTRDPSKVDQKALAAKIGPRRAKSIMEGLEAFSREMRPKDERLRNDVYQHTNGPHALQRLIAQAEATLPPSEVQGYILALGKGGSAARRAVENLQAIVSGEAIPPHRRVHAEHAAPAPRNTAAAGITSAAYVAALSALHGRGSRLSFEARDRREAELHEARRIGRASGLR